MAFLDEVMKVSDYFKRLREGKIKVVLGDCSPSIRKYFEKRDYQVARMVDFDFCSEDDVFVVSNSQRASDHMIDNVFGNHNCHCAHINPWKLHGNKDTTLTYTFDRILEMDIETALSERQQLNSIIRSKLKNYLSIKVADTTLHIDFVGPVEVTNTDIVMNRGWNYSIAEFLEIGLLNFGDVRETGFVVSGEMQFDGLVSFVPRRQKGERELMAKKLLLAVNKSSDKRIYVQRNIITSILLDGADYTNLLVDCFGNSIDDPEFNQETQLKEIAFGCNHLNNARIDWTKNALINEGIYGFHLGFGLAEKSSHLDFIHQGDYGLSW